jgi:hypothetical protein
MQKVKQSYYNLLMIAASIRQYWVAKVALESFLNIVVPDELEMQEDISMPQVRANFDLQNIAVKSFIIIQTCAFLEEYKMIFSISADDPELASESSAFKTGLKIILRPAISFINKSWKDLYAVRNNLLAHNWRKDGQLIMFSSLTDEPSNAPWIDEEFTLLVGIFDSIIEILKDYRPDYYQEMSLIITEKSKKKVHHMTRSTTHEESVKLAQAVKGLMKLELDHLNEKI